MCNGALAHFTVINSAVAHCFKKVGHPGCILYIVVECYSVMTDSFDDILLFSGVLFVLSYFWILNWTGECCALANYVMLIYKLLQSGCCQVAVRLLSGCGQAEVRLRSGCGQAAVRLRSGCGSNVTSHCKHINRCSCSAF